MYYMDNPVNQVASVR